MINKSVETETYRSPAVDGHIGWSTAHYELNTPTDEVVYNDSRVQTDLTSAVPLDAIAWERKLVNAIKESKG